MEGRSTCSYLSQRSRLAMVLFLLFTSFTLLTYHYKQLSSASSVDSKVNVKQMRVVNTMDTFGFEKQYKGVLEHRLPKCLIIGVRKGGTMALLQYMGLHPDIITAENEVHFFDTEHKYSKGYAYYKNQLPLSYENQIVVEKTPAYFVDKSTPLRVKKMNSSIKLLLTVRDPVVRVISDYAMKQDKAVQKGKQFPSFKNLLFTKTGTVNGSSISIGFSTYYVHMKRWLKYFPRKQFHIVNGDNLILKPFEEISKVETFLNLPHVVTQERFVYNETKGFYCFKTGNVTQCLAPTKGRTHPDVEATLVEKLREYFRDKNEKFFDLIGERFDW